MVKAISSANRLIRLALSQMKQNTSIKVLYIHHAAPFGGASRSLLEMIQSFPEDTVQTHVLTRRGQFYNILKNKGMSVLGCRGVSQFDNTRYSYYKGWRWLILLREFAYLPSTLLGLLNAKRKWKQFDIIHINELTLLPTIWLVGHIFHCPIIVHTRSVQQPLKGWRGKLISSILHKKVAQLIAIDQTVKASLKPSLNAKVIHNGLRVKQHLSTSSTTNTHFTVGMVGGLSRAKGCLELIEAAAICRAQGANIRFVFVGQSIRSPSPVRDFVLKKIGISQEIKNEVDSKIKHLGLGGSIEFWSFTTNLERVYQQFHIVCFPSHFDAPGRPIFEAALFGVPSIAAVQQSMPDSIVDNVTGLIIRPKDPKQLAHAIMYLYSNPSKRTTMGDNAKKMAHKHFDANKNALEMLDIYLKTAKTSAKEIHS